MEHNYEKLMAHILPLSVAKVFDHVRLEWNLIGIEVSEEFDNCPCGQQIKESRELFAFVGSGLVV